MPASVLVTGAAGHLGSHLISALLAEGFRVTGLDLAEPASPSPDCRYFRSDLSEAPDLTEALQGAEIVVHCASIHPWKPYSDAQYLDFNVKGTWNLFDAAAKAGIGRIVLTSSIAAAGYHYVPIDAWPIDEEYVTPVGDLYSLTKRAQEEIARLHAARGSIRTLALRPPAFMPLPDLQAGFNLTGAYALVEDIVSAHVAAVRVFAGTQAPGAPLRDFEAVNVTNRLPYSGEDARLIGSDGELKPLVKKYWPDALDWLIERGYDGRRPPAAYDISKAEKLLNWRPRTNFEEWYERRAKA